MTVLSKDQPYPGLRPYGSGDEEFFFGREAHTRALVQKLETSRLVAVVGRSGCGKSSLVRAGLVPLLNKQLDSNGERVWHIASFRPQGRPIAELTAELLRLTSEARKARAEPSPADGAAPDDRPQQGPAPIAPEDMAQLRRSRLEAMLRRSSRGLVEAAGEIGIPASGRILIIVDQFEEIFRFEDPSGSNTDEATAFVRLLTEAVTGDNPGIQILLTMRLDFLGDCARFARLPEAISDGQFLVPNLSRAERRSAIEEPARKAGKSVRPEVTQRLLNEIGDDPDQLPVLQHVLMRMWQQAGSGREITLKDYEDTGGVSTAISRHADQIYADLASDAHRKAAERLFKAISERDRRSRSIRRITRFDEIAAIVAGDDETITAAKSGDKLREVIEAFRAPDSCFVMPPVGEEIAPHTLIDISHESLLRGWGKLAGTPGKKDGWIAEEADNGRIYNDLLGDEERQYVFPSKEADERQQWWRTTRPNAAWAERYGNNFAAVKDFFQGVCDHHRRESEILRNKAVRTRRWRIATAIVILLLPFATLGLFYFWAEEQALRAKKGEEQIAQEKSRLAREYDARLNQALADFEAQKSQLEKYRREVTRTVEQVQKTVPLNDRKVHEDLSNLVQSNTTISDATAQRAIVDTKGDAPAATLSSNTGFMWIGSTGTTIRSNFNTPEGVAVAADAVKPGEQYTTDLDIYLRQGLPDRPGYTQQPTLGIMPEGTRVQVLAVAPPFARSGGDQYWAQVRVVKLALSTVYFQFAGGSRNQAQDLSKALQRKGYKIPGEERTVDAAGKHEVRYFYDGQKAIAQQLAADTNKELQELKYSQRVTAEFAPNPTKSNPDGKLELWLEIPPK